MSDAAGIEETHSALESRVSAEVNAAEFQAMNGLLRPLAMRFYLERFPYLQIVDIASTIKDDVSKVSFERSESEWLIHSYGKVAMSASAGEFLFSDGQVVDGFTPKHISLYLRFREDGLAPLTFYGFVGKELKFNVKFDNVDTQFDAKSHLGIPGLQWKTKLAEEAEQVVSLTPSKTGTFPIHYPGKTVCGQLMVLDEPTPLPRRGTLMHQADVTAKRMIQMAVEQGWEGIMVAGGSQRMKMASWIAAKALGVPIEGVDYNDYYDVCYDRVMAYSGQRLEKLIKETKTKKRSHK